MSFNLSGVKQDLAVDIDAVAALIVNAQKKDGEIPWCRGEKTDPWDHVEAAMGLCVGGYIKEARRAFEWMARMQLADGSWYASYRDSIPEDKTRDTNMSSYIAVGVLHHFLVTGDIAFLKKLWPTVKAAINFALSLQSPGGEIYWAVSPKGRVDPMALLTGSCSVYMSLKCALAIARQLGRQMPAWRDGLMRLRDAVRHRPYNFNMTKSRYSMDWFYPILAGVLSGEKAQKR